MNGALTIQSYTEVAKERSSVSGNFVTFTGVGLEEAKLKDWLRGCAPQVALKSFILLLLHRCDVEIKFYVD